MSQPSWSQSTCVLADRKPLSSPSSFPLAFWSESGGLNNRAKLINHISCRRRFHAWCVKAHIYIYMFIVMNEKRLAVIELIGPKIGDGPLWPTKGHFHFYFRRSLCRNPKHWGASIHGQRRKLFSHINYAPRKPPHWLIDTIYNRKKRWFLVKIVFIHWWPVK